MGADPELQDVRRPSAVARLRQWVLPRRKGMVRRLGYAALGLLLGAVYAGLFAGLVAAALLSVYGVGLLIFVLVLMLARGLGGWERRLARRFLGVDVEDPVALRRHADGVVRRLRVLLLASSTWRTLAWLGIRALAAAALATTLFFGLGLSYLLLWYPENLDTGRSIPMDLTALVLVTITWLAVLRIVDAVVRLLALVARPLLDTSPEERLSALRRATVRLAERTSVARDLHDTIGHTLTASLVQAGAAGRALAPDPSQPSRTVDVEFARQALGHIEDNIRNALAELDQALAVLGDPARARRDGEARPDLHDLDGLLAGLHDAGLPLTVRFGVPPADIPVELSRFAYRLVQEGTTNVLRHAGVAATHVEVDGDDGHLVVRVRNERTGRGHGHRPPGGGRGLHGLATRARELRGTLSAGETTDGYELTACLPWKAGRRG